MKFKKALTVILAASVMATSFGVPAMAETAVKIQETETASPEYTVTSSLGMFAPSDVTVKINANATADITFTVASKGGRIYNKIALVSQTETESEKDKAAVESTVHADNSSTFTINIPIEKLGEKIPFSTYQTIGETSGWHNWKAQHYITVANTPAIVDQLIDQIYIQKNNEYTDAMIQQARTSYQNLTEEQKSAYKAGNYTYGDYFVSTGDASKDDPLNTAPDKKKELLVVSFGTSYTDSRVATIGGVESALKKAYPDYSVRRAFTSQIIINHIKARDKEQINNVEEAMDQAVKAGVTELVVQPTTLMHGYEYDEMKEAIDSYAKKYAGTMKVTYAEPLLNSDFDKREVAKASVAAAAEDAGYKDAAAAVADKDTAFVFMGHGTSHEAQNTYDQMQDIMTDLGYQNCFIGTVEGKPADTALEAVVKKVKASGYKKVVLRPLMVVAGDHANNDMAGDEEDSWKSGFAKAVGADQVTCQIAGLGQIAAVQQIYAKHTKAAINPADNSELENALQLIPSDLSLFTADTAKAVREARDNADPGLSSEEQSQVSGMASAVTEAVQNLVAKDGTYKLPGQKDGMFRLVDVYLIVKDGKMDAVFAQSSTSQPRLYLGSKEEAATGTYSELGTVTNSEGNQASLNTVPLEKFNKNISFATWSTKNKKWYDRTVSFAAKDLAVSALPTGWQSAVKHTAAEQIPSAWAKTMVENAESSIAAIDSKITTASGEKITAARKVYDALPDSLKDSVKNADKLTAAEKEFAVQKANAEKEAASKKAIAAIRASRVNGVKAAAQPSKKKVTVSYKAVKGADSYRIAYKVNSGKWKYQKVKGTKAVLKVSANSTVRIRVQAAKKVNSAVYYGKYSAEKIVLINQMAIKKVKSGKKSLTIFWKKAKGITGYQVQYAEKKNMKRAKTVTISSAKKSSASVKKLKKSKKYYVRVRAYKKIGKTKVTGSWSSVKSAKTR
ncbi:MAG: sirohydrochlorin cobaltochelatase [Eubacterium sp.]|jgi:sirohydrochlorin cobaltochelatase